MIHVVARLVVLTKGSVFIADKRLDRRARAVKESNKKEVFA